MMEVKYMSQEQKYDSSRREFFKKIGKVAYVAPVILTLHATPSFACEGSCSDPEYYANNKDECKGKLP
jgi:hypothetical protein